MKAAHLTLALAAMTLPQPAAAEARKKPRYDPDRMICESREVIGSRLQRVRVCHTAQEWEEVRTQEKVGLMRRQHNGGSGAGGPTPRDTPF
jgi:3-phenylpropionate/cinnamic acid dioxygenase small subunit